MRSRWFIAAAVWGLTYGTAYLLVIRSQDGTPAWWYLTLLGLGVVLSGWAGLTRSAPVRVIGSVALACWSAAALVALVSVGLLLLPAVAFAIVGLSRAVASASADSAMAAGIGRPAGPTPPTRD